MWAQIGVKVKVNAMPRVLYFPKLEKFDSSLYMYGWGGAITDAETIMTPVWRNQGPGGMGLNNYGRWVNDKFDALAAASTTEIDPAKREQLVKQALLAFKQEINVLPLHRQMIPWAVRNGVQVVHRPDNWLEVAWVTLPTK
jgi:peptide/nickel transport system substrate-binding protein